MNVHGQELTTTVLRQFLYRDDELIQEFLAQLEGGVFDEDAETTRRSSGKRAGGRLRPALAELELGRGSEEAREVERIVKQTGASRFDRFYTALDEGGSLQFLDHIDEEIWHQIRRGEILEMEATMSPAGLGPVAEMFDIFSRILPIAEAAGATDSASIDEEARSVMNFVSELDSMFGSDDVPVVMSLASSPAYRFACKLRAAHLLADKSLLEGEVTVCGKLQRKLRSGESYLATEVFGGLESVLPEKDRQELNAIFDNPEVAKLGIANPKIHAPGGVITPIAIYR